MTKSHAKHVLALILLCIGSIASATDGTQLLAACQEAEQFDERKPVRDPFSIGTCLGLLEGVNGAMVALNSSLPVSIQTCFPEQRLAAVQAVRIAVKYLRENPEKHHESAAYLVALAYRRAFPCNR